VMKNYALSHRNLFDLLRMTPTHNSIDDLWAALPCIGYEIRHGLSVVAAHPMLSAYDNDLAFEVQMRNHQPNYMARLGWLLEFLLKHNDLVLLDLSPSNSFFNQMALASSSYFVLPLSGDRFSLQSLDTLDLVLSLMRNNFSYRMARPLPQLLCGLYNQYSPGDKFVTGFNNHGYKVSDTDYTQYCAIEAVFLHRRKDLAICMVGQELPRIIMVSEARDLYKRLGHMQLTVFDSLPTPNAELVTQKNEYDILWQCLHDVLFSSKYLNR